MNDTIDMLHETINVFFFGVQDKLVQRKQGQKEIGIGSKPACGRCSFTLCFTFSGISLYDDGSDRQDCFSRVIAYSIIFIYMHILSCGYLHISM